MIPYSEIDHVEPLLVISKKFRAIDNDFIIENIEQQYDLIKTFENKLYENFTENGFETSLFQKYFKYIDPQKVDLDSLIGRWVFFPDISMQLGFQESFGIIYGARDTNSWQGMTYFVKRPHVKSLIQIANATVLLFDIESSKFKFDKVEAEIQELFNLLNIYCEFFYNDEWNVGKLISFDENIVTFQNENGDCFDFTIEEYKSKTRNFKEDIGDLSFVIKKG